MKLRVYKIENNKLTVYKMNIYSELNIETGKQITYYQSLLSYNLDWVSSGGKSGIISKDFFKVNSSFPMNLDDYSDVYYFESEMRNDRKIELIMPKMQTMFKLLVITKDTDFGLPLYKDNLSIYAAGYANHASLAIETIHSKEVYKLDRRFFKGRDGTMYIDNSSDGRFRFEQISYGVFVYMNGKALAMDVKREKCGPSIFYDLKKLTFNNDSIEEVDKYGNTHKYEIIGEVVDDMYVLYKYCDQQ